MTNFVRAANPIWYMVDTAGVPLNDTHYIFFLTNDLPYIPLAVYHDPDGLIPWSNPIQFQPSGTLPNNIYFNEDNTYRIEVRKGPSQTDPLIWLIEDFSISGASGEADALLTAQNIVINPQFADVDFTPTGYTFTQGTPGTYTLDVAPGWQLVLTGAGTTILTQTALPGNSDLPGNPNYYLTINNSGWTTATLIQTFVNNGAIFGDGAIAITFSAFATSSGQPLTVSYVPSTGTSTVIFSGSIGTGTLEPYYGATNLPASTNSDEGLAASVSFDFTLPPTGILSFANIQIVGQDTPLSDTFVIPNGTVQGSVPSYVEQTYAQQVNEEFNIYKTSMLLQAKSNILVGWTFALNPWQFITAAPTLVTNKCQYIADQTILYQETASALSSGQGGGGVNFGLQLQAQTGTAANRFAIIQYIDTATIAPYWGQNLSCLVRAAIFSSFSTVTNIKMRLIYRSNLPPALGNSEPITGWDSNGDVIFAAGWTAVKPLNDISYQLGATSNNNLPEYAFNQFKLPTSPTTNAYVGVVIYITTPINTTSGFTDIVAFDRVSLTPNDYAIDASPETYDETLRKCQFYYEKSYPAGSIPGTAVTTTGVVSISGGSSSANLGGFFRFSFGQNFTETKRVAPNLSYASTSSITIYSYDSATAGLYNAQIIRNNTNPAPVTGTNPADFAISQFNLINVSSDRFTMQPSNTSTSIITLSAGQNGDEALLSYHYTVDVRLGVSAS